MRFVLALDQGTTSSRAIVFDRDARVCGLAQREFAQQFPHDGWVEHDPMEIWASQLATARDAMAQAGAAARDVAAIGITNQRETTILWERASGRPVANAIVWQDRRTAGVTAALAAAGRADWIARKTGLVLDPYFSGTKIAWLLDDASGLRERAERGEIAFGTVDSWLIWNLTGGRVHATDHTNASRTMLLDLHALQWDDELLALLRVPRAVLPELRRSIDAYGTTDPALFGEGIAIGGVAGDQQAALFGQAGFRPGIAKNTYGTGSFVVYNTGENVVRSRNGLLATVAFTAPSMPPSYAVEGSVFVTGAAVQWLRDGLGIVPGTGAVEALARSVDDSGGVVFVPALTGLGAPHWDPQARGAFFGLTRATTKAHVARATLEAMAFQTVDVIDAMVSDGAQPLRELRVDGGAATNDLAMQMQADLLGCDVVRPRITETTALGAAFLAGVQAGIWTLDGVASLWRAERRFTPAMDPQRRASALERWRRAVRCARDFARGDGEA